MSERVKKSFWQNPAVLISAGAILVFSAYFYLQKGGGSGPSQPVPVNNAVPPITGTTPKPYEYNSATNKHWDPAHQHWHDGPPPTGTPNPQTTSPNPVVTPATLPPGTPTPKPYEYNAATNQHWDPTHQHWHNGKPPVADTIKTGP